jgi:hypothetical protein
LIVRIPPLLISMMSLKRSPPIPLPSLLSFLFRYQIKRKTLPLPLRGNSLVIEMPSSSSSLSHAYETFQPTFGVFDEETRIMIRAGGKKDKHIPLATEGVSDSIFSLHDIAGNEEVRRDTEELTVLLSPLLFSLLFRIFTKTLS